MKFEGSRFGGMLKHTTPTTDGGQCRCKASVVIVYLVAPSFMIDRAQLVPSLTGRMGHDRPRAIVQPRITLDRLQVHVRQTGIDALGVNE